MKVILWPDLLLVGIEQIPCPLCKAMIRSQQSFVKQYMELCEHCKNKFALKFCVCKKTQPADRRHQEKYATSHHKERYALRDRRGLDKGWMKLTPQEKLLEKDKIFYKNMYDFFRHFPPCSRKVPEYKIKPLLDDRLYGNVENFFRKIGPSSSYDSIYPALYDDHIISERDESQKYKHYGTASDRDNFRGVGPSISERSAIDDSYPMTERHAKRQMDSGGGVDGRSYRRTGGPSSDDHRSIGSKGYSNAYKLFGTGSLGAQTAFDINEENTGRKSDRAHKGYLSEPDTMAASSSRSSARKKGSRKGDDLLMVHDRGTFKYVEKSPEVEKFKEYMEEVREKQRKEKEEEDRKWSLAFAGKKPELKSKVRVKIKSARDSQKKEGRESGKKGKQGSGDEEDVEEDKKKVPKDTDEELLKKMQSNEAIVPITEAALHLEDLDKRTSERQRRLIEQRLQLVATKRGKPIIVEFIKRKKKSPRVRQGSRAYFSRLNSFRSLTERRRKENVEPEKLSELDVLNVSSSQGLDSIIIGPKLYQYRPPLKESGEPNIYDALLHTVMPVVEPTLECMPLPEPKPRKEKKGSATAEPTEVKALAKPTDWDDHSHRTEEMSTDGIISYALSDRRFIEKGWSKLPTEHIVRRMNVYRMRSTNPESDWFERNKCNEIMKFESGEKFAEFNNEEGRCQIYYKNGKIALDHYKSEEPLSQKRIVIYSKDLCSANKPQSILAIFDHLGNGVVFDHNGKIRLKFNQTEGIVLDKSLGPYCHWEWHSLNDPPQLKHIMVDTNLIYKDQDIFKVEDHHNVPKRLVDEAVHAIELDNIVKEKKKKMTLPYKRFPIRIKSVKINDQFTLLIIDQATIYIKFREGSTFFKTNIGLILDQNEIVDTVTEKLGAVMNSVERRPAPTESLAALQRAVLQAQRDEKRWKSRDRKINRPADHNDELDRKMTLMSKPIRKVPSPLQQFDCNCDLLCTCHEK